MADVRLIVVGEEDGLRKVTRFLFVISGKVEVGLYDFAVAVDVRPIGFDLTRREFSFVLQPIAIAFPRLDVDDLDLVAFPKKEAVLPKPRVDAMLLEIDEPAFSDGSLVGIAVNDFLEVG